MNSPLGRTISVGLLLAASFNLRTTMVGISAVIPDIIADTGISAETAGMLTAAPLLCLGLFGIPAPPLAARWGFERAIFLSLLGLAVATAMRALPWFPALMIGAMATGAFTGIIGVLLPGVIKRDHAARQSQTTGLTTMLLAAGSAIAAALMHPLMAAMDGSWRLALAVWAVPSLIAAVIWLPAVRTNSHNAALNVRKVDGLWRDAIAWAITLYMALQSGLAFTVFAWLTPILRERGMTAEDAGLMLSLLAVVQLAIVLVAPILAAKQRHQSVAAVIPLVMMLVGFAGCVYGPMDRAWLSVVILGLGQGGVFAVALTLIVLRSRDAHVASALSSMVQSIGYSLAAFLPWIAGLLHDVTGDWTAMAWMYAACTLLGMTCGIFAGRSRFITVTAGAI